MKLKCIFQSCAICGGWPTDQGTLYCSLCWERIAHWMQESHGEIILNEKISIQFGMTWSPADSSLKGDFLHALKGKSCRQSWRRLAEIWWVLRSSKTEYRAHSCHIWESIPGHNGELDDHASRWLEALRELLGGQRVRSLSRTLNGGQRKKSREERKRIGFEVKETHTLSKPTTLVDDVVTTGATAFAAFEALGSPKNLQLFALAYRIRVARSIESDLSVRWVGKACEMTGFSGITQRLCRNQKPIYLESF